MILADKIIALRKKCGWSQEELAEKLEVSRQAVSKWEGAQTMPDLNKILKMAELFGVSTDVLLKDECTLEERTAQTVESAGEAAARMVTMEEANAYLALRWQAAKQIGLAAVLCILSPIALLLLGALCDSYPALISENAAAGLGLCVLFLLAALAVALFILCGHRSAAFRFLDTEPIETAYGVSGMVQERKARFSDTYARCNVLGTFLCILSLVPFFGVMAFTENLLYLILGLCVMLALISTGVFLFISAGVPWAAMERLLQEGDYTINRKRRSGRVSAVTTIYWLLATAVYLLYSFASDDWARSWIIWPVAGVFYPALVIALNAFGAQNGQRN